LFGDEEHMNAERLQLLVTGLQQYTVSGLRDTTLDAAEQPILDSTTQGALRVVFSPEGSYAQELLVEEAVAATDAATRQVASMLVTRLLGNAPALAGLSAMQALQPWRPVPLPAPADALSR
jgi:aarF domain-containing kinase